MLSAHLQLARPKDWIKNIFILIPLPFAWVASQKGATAFAVHWPVFLVGFVCFCLTASAVYTLNDLIDATKDRLHPNKCKRPIASGAVSPLAAKTQLILLLLAGLGPIYFFCSPEACQFALIYVILNAFYCFGGKHIPLLDIFILASGFVIRVLFGVAMIGATASAWLLLCTSALALFLCFAKRRSDLVQRIDVNHRPSLQGYRISFLDHSMLICAAMALLTYAIYSIESKVFLPGREMASMPFVAYGIFNYLRLAETQNEGDSPVDIAFKSRSSQLCALAWVAAVLWSLGIGNW